MNDYYQNLNYDLKIQYKTINKTSRTPGDDTDASTDATILMSFDEVHQIHPTNPFLREADPQPRNHQRHSDLLNVLVPGIFSMALFVAPLANWKPHTLHP